MLDGTEEKARGDTSQHHFFPLMQWTLITATHERLEELDTSASLDAAL